MSSQFENVLPRLQRAANNLVARGGLEPPTNGL
jgi:hypothetical protein